MLFALNPEVKPTPDKMIKEIQTFMKNNTNVPYDELRKKIKGLSKLPDNEIMQCLQDSGFESVDDGVTVPDLPKSKPSIIDVLNPFTNKSTEE